MLHDLKCNDPPAWQSLVRHYSSLIYAECRSQGLRPQEAADVTQDVFQCVFTLLPRFEQRRRTGSFRRWLRMITRNKIREHARREGNQPTCTGGTAAHRRLTGMCAAQETAAKPGVSGREHTAAIRHALRAAKQDFAHQTWLAFWRTAVDACDATQIADELQMTPQAVRKAKSRVLARLRELLQTAVDL